VDPTNLPCLCRIAANAQLADSPQGLETKEEWRGGSMPFVPQCTVANTQLEDSHQESSNKERVAWWIRTFRASI